MSAIAGILAQARDARAFSAAGWSFGDAAGAWERGTMGTLAWDGDPVDDGSWWDLASVSKPIVAMAVMSLVETGELTLDDSIGHHLPNLPADKHGITVRQLLTHTSGLPGQVPLYRWTSDGEELIRAIGALAAVPPDTRVIYSSQGYIVLGLIAEQASGLPLDVLVSERVFQPAGMRHASFGLHPRDHAHAVATENDPWRGRIVQGEVHDENAVVLGRPGGHAGVFATLADLESLAQALCANGRGILSPSTFRAMIRPQTDHLDARWSLGWVCAGRHLHGSSAGDLVSTEAFGHTGFTGTSLWVDPSVGRYSVLLTNRVHPNRTSDAIGRVRRRVNNVAFGAPPPGA